MPTVRSFTMWIASPLFLLALLSPGSARASLEPRAPRHLAVAHERLALNGPVALPPGLLLAAENAEEPSEAGRIILGYIGGVGLQIVGVGLSIIPLAFAIEGGTFSASNAIGASIVGLVMLTIGAPALSSLAVWAITNSGPTYQTSYLLTFLGGIVGTVAVIPFGFIDNAASFEWALLLLVPPLGETVFASVTRERKPPRPGNIYRADVLPPSQPVAILDRGEQPRTLAMQSAPLFSLAIP